MRCCNLLHLTFIDAISLTLIFNPFWCWIEHHVTHGWWRGTQFGKTQWSTFSVIWLVSWFEVWNLDWIEYENTHWRKVKQIQKHSGALLALYSWWYGVKSVTLMTTMWQQRAKWTDSTCKTMGCVNFICQTSLNLYFYFHLIVTMATCPFKIQTCLDCATWLHWRAQIKSQSIHPNLATCI